MEVESHTPQRLTIQVSQTRVVSGLLLLPDRAKACLVLAHGAGAGMTHPFMIAAAAGLSDRGIGTLRYQFPYMEAGSRRPDGPGLAQATVRAAVNEANVRLPDLALFAGGKSFGGRMTSQAQAKSPLPNVRGIAFFGFPLHPAGKPSVLRARHLSEVQIPMLFLQGDRDALAQPDLRKTDRRGSRRSSDRNSASRRGPLIPRPRTRRTHRRTGQGIYVRRTGGLDRPGDRQVDRRLFTRLATLPRQAHDRWRPPPRVACGPHQHRQVDPQPSRSAKEKIYAEPRVTVPAIALVVPERIHWLIGVAGADSIDPTLIEQTPEAGPAFGLQECIFRPGPARINVAIRWHDIEIAGQHDGRL